jgi:NAD(P)-dependent dehydrogenase (short-subunit alcohol dehydrogenase family)
MTTGDFSTKTAIVTGAGSGIGRATALQIAGRGGNVIVADLNEQGATETVRQITEAGGAAQAVIGDLSQLDTIEAVVTAAVREYGSLDILIANAGIADDSSATADVTDELWSRLLDINLTAPFRLARAVIPHMTAAGGGAIVFTASTAGLRGSAAGTAYTVVKHGIVGLTLSTAIMYREAGIRVNAVAPGATRTGMVPDQDALLSAPATVGLTTIASYRRNIGELAEPDTIATAIAFLASDAASNITGAILPVDGGWSAV